MTEHTDNTEEVNNIELGDLPELKKLDVTIPKLKMIRFGEEFDQWTKPKQIEYLKRLASSMNQAADILQNERNELLTQVASLKSQIENADTNVAQNKTIMINAVTQYNQERQELVQQIQELQTRVRAQDKVIELLNEKLKNS